MKKIRNPKSETPVLRRKQERTEIPGENTSRYRIREQQTMKNLILANLEENLCLTECVNRALKVMRFTIHTGLKLTLFELHHGRKPRTELTNLVKDGKSYLSDWTKLSVSAEEKPKTPIYVSRNEEGDVTNYLLMAETKTQ